MEEICSNLGTCEKCAEKGSAMGEENHEDSRT